MSSDLYAAILRHAASDPAHEVCGLLLGTHDAIVATVQCANVAVDPAVRFEIDPVALLSVHRAARGGAPAVAGCYHSHPTGRAEPSPRDAADAAPDGSLWLIVAGDVLTAWRSGPDGALYGRFDRVTLHCDTGESIRDGNYKGRS